MTVNLPSVEALPSVMTFWRRQYWKDIKFNKLLWRRVYKSYTDLLREEEYLSSHISGKSGYTLTPDMVTRALSRATDAWINVKVSGYSFQNVEFKSLELTPQGTLLYVAYREAAFKIFYKCCKIVYDARVAAGLLTLDKWEECMQGVKEQERLAGH